MQTIYMDGQSIDLEKRLRLVKPARHGVPSFTCEGVLSEAPQVTMMMADVLTIELSFFGGATVEWVPAFGDVLKNVAE